MLPDMFVARLPQDRVDYAATQFERMRTYGPISINSFCTGLFGDKIAFKPAIESLLFRALPNTRRDTFKYDDFMKYDFGMEVAAAPIKMFLTKKENDQIMLLCILRRPQNIQKINHNFYISYRSGDF